MPPFFEKTELFKLLGVMLSALRFSAGKAFPYQNSGNDYLTVMAKIKYKRQILVVAGLVILIAAVAAAWYFFSEQILEPETEKTRMAVAVEVMQVQNKPVQTYIELTGRLQPEDQIAIFSEVTGIMEDTKKPFKVGVNYRKGELLLRINNDESRQNLISRRTGFISLLANTVADIRIDFPEIYDDWANYLAAVKPNQSLPSLPEVEERRQKLFLTGRNIYGEFHAVKQLEERLAKYAIYAPFTGSLTEVMINKGSLVMQGQQLGEFVKTGSYELKTSVVLKDRGFINIGDTVSMRPVQMDRVYQGSIARLSEKVDPQMQSIEVYVKVEGEDLTNGMYLEGRVAAEKFPLALRISRRLLVEENKVFTVEDSIAKLQEVDVLKLTSDDAVIRGVKDGATLIMEERTAAFENSRVLPVKQEDL